MTQGSSSLRIDADSCRLTHGLQASIHTVLKAGVHKRVPHRLGNFNFLFNTIFLWTPSQRLSTSSEKIAIAAAFYQ